MAGCQYDVYVQFKIPNNMQLHQIFSLLKINTRISSHAKQMKRNENRKSDNALMPSITVTMETRGVRACILQENIRNR